MPPSSSGAPPGQSPREDSGAPGEASGATLTQALKLQQEGNYPAAARIYLELAAGSGGDRATRLLDAVESLMQAGDLEQARGILAGLPELPGETLLGSRRRVLEARQALLRREYAQVFTLLPATWIKGLEPATEAEAHRVLALAQREEGRDLEAAQEWLLAARAEEIEEARSHDHAELWNVLLRVSAGKLRTALGAGERQEELGAWMGLALIFKEAMEHPATLHQTLHSWSIRYPEHPAQLRVLPRLRELERLYADPPKQVAVLLPLSGPYAVAGSLVRDGILAARYLRREQGKTVPHLRFYDTAGSAVGLLLEMALKDGAEFILGPLRREQVVALLEEHPAPLPLLLLNHAPEAASRLEAWNRGYWVPKVIQFDLLQEEESRLAAERAWFDGKTGAITIVPEEPRGERLAAAFAEHWQALGGRMELQLSYRPERLQELHNLIGLLVPHYGIPKPETVPGGKLTVDPPKLASNRLIFFAGDLSATRQLMPLLRFYELQHLTVYATSRVYSGLGDPDLDADLENLRFPDMPWMLDPSPEQQDLLKQLRLLKQRGSRESGRLFAFGMDAYDLMGELVRLVLQPSRQFYAGRTGHLSLDKQGHVRRRLPWARFNSGYPRVEESWRLF